MINKGMIKFTNLLIKQTPVLIIIPKVTTNKRFTLTKKKKYYQALNCLIGSFERNL